MALEAGSGIAHAYLARRERKRLRLIGGLALLLLMVTIVAAGTGALAIAPIEVVRLLWSWLTGGPALETAEGAVLIGIRLPRVILGAVVGAALAVSGAALQGLFRNPLADPGLIGISTGAALAAAIAIVLGLGAFGTLLAAFALPVAAFLGGLGATALVYWIATREGRTEVATLLLAGIAINAIAAAGIGLMIFLSPDEALRDLNFWMLGSLAKASWGTLWPVGVLAGGALLGLFALARPLNLLALGESDAGHLGLDVEQAKRLIVALAALAAGAAVAVSGVIGFVGLVVPHLIRLFAEPDHRLLLPASALLGASLLVLADLFARMVVLPAELPIGIVTALLGGPFFLWLLMRRRGGGFW